jgi:hypothetical protein
MLVISSEILIWYTWLSLSLLELMGIPVVQRCFLFILGWEIPEGTTGAATFLRVLDLYSVD